MDGVKSKRPAARGHRPPKPASSYITRVAKASLTTLLVVAYTLRIDEIGYLPVTPGGGTALLDNCFTTPL